MNLDNITVYVKNAKTYRKRTLIATIGVWTLTACSLALRAEISIYLFINLASSSVITYCYIRSIIIVRRAEKLQSEYFKYINDHFTIVDDYLGITDKSKTKQEPPSSLN